MKTMVQKTFVFVLLTLSLAVIPILAQGKVTVDVAFDFSAAGTKFPAGSYALETTRQSGSAIWIRNLASGNSVAVPYITRLSPRSADKAEFVFDKDGDNAYLSEVYVPGTDGYHLKGAPGKHTHVSVQGKK